MLNASMTEALLALEQLAGPSGLATLHDALTPQQDALRVAGLISVVADQPGQSATAGKGTAVRLTALGRSLAASARTAPASGSVEFRHFFGKAMDARRGGIDAWGVMSTGEKVAVALALNQPDWLARMDYTLAEAIERTGPEWIALLPAVAKAVREQG